MNHKNKNTFVVFDGNEAASYVAYRTNEICIIYPITPASYMGELTDQWAAEDIKNIWGTTPKIVTMQSEGGAAGAVHGALQTGALATTFTSSQGLLLMIPNMYRIAGELTPTVFHIATRAIASQGMSIYGDHSDIYATRATGFAMLCAANVQEAHDMALITQAAALKTRIPFLHFFDGFRTSHEVAKIELLSHEQIRAMIDDDLVIAGRNRRLTPENPSIRGVVSDHDIYFQGREATNTFYASLPSTLEKTLQQFKKITGRTYKLVEYYGDPKAERIIIIMGSATETAQETVAYLNQKKAKVGLIKIRLFRPFPKKQFLNALPKTCKAIAILDRTKEPGAAGEPLYEEIATTILENYNRLPKQKIIAGRYGIASKEFTPTMVKAVFDELQKANPKNHFTIGINDDVTHTSLKYDNNFDIEPASVFRAVFYGLGADGTVGANKNSIKIIGEETNLYAQGYFVYDAKKTGSRTVSHLRFGPNKIHSTYLIKCANFIGCHQFNFIEKIPILERAAPNATFLLNSSTSADKVWNVLPRSLQQTIIDKKIKFYVIDGYKIARDLGMKNHINTIMQTCFFALSNIIPLSDAIAKIKASIKKTYSSKGDAVLQRNYAAVDNTLANLTEVKIPPKATSHFDLPPTISNNAPKFMQKVVGKMLAGRGDELPVSALPCDGTYPTNSTCWEKRNTSHEIPIWIPEDCVQCGLCHAVCPHSAIRAKRYAKDALQNAPVNFPYNKLKGTDTHEECFTLQIYPEDCTGCAACVEVCPINKGKNNKKALIMQPKISTSEKELSNIKFFESLPVDPEKFDKTSVRGIQYITPMFEFCAACAGCGETPYIKLLTQLFGDRLTIADACGCTLAYGGYLPTIPWTINSDGRGPAFGASLFEDNAEFGYGFLLTAEKHREQALELITKLAAKINNPKLIHTIINTKQNTDHGITTKRKAVAELKNILKKINSSDAKQLLSLADQLIKQSIWALGGDGWAYDIGFGGLDHVLASGKNIKVLVLDTEVYSNTGGQSSKATPRGAVVKFAMGGKLAAKKDLGLMLMSYGNIYIANVAIGANPAQAIKAFQEAENYDGPAIIIAYSHCISHGIDMVQGMQQQKLAVQCGHWPLYRYNPDRIKDGLSPLQLDSEKPSILFKEYAQNENRYQILMRTKPE
ncbi:MAG: pyruvate:ferredoxin (flavodoxin) oxidoreductase, partial [Gammaproteobacteria bacterium RBG_16_37_9]